jgi:hypothetical protein
MWQPQHDKMLWCAVRTRRSSRTAARGYSIRWEEGFSRLKHFSEREGHCRVPRSHKTEEGYRLGQWVNVQRTNKKGLDPSRLQRLEALSGWDWDPYLSRWEEGFSRLKHFSEREGHCRVPQSYKTEEGYRLGQWVSVQRRTNNKGLDPGRRQRLAALSGWDWDPNLSRWVAMGGGILQTKTFFGARGAL